MDKDICLLNNKLVKCWCRALLEAVVQIWFFMSGCLEDKTNSACLNLASLRLIPRLTTGVNFLKSHCIISWFEFLQFLAAIDVAIPLRVKFSFSMTFQVLHGVMPATSQTSSYHPYSYAPTKQTCGTYLTWCSYSCHPHSSLLLAWLASSPPPQNSVKWYWIDTISEGRERSWMQVKDWRFASRRRCFSKREMWKMQGISENTSGRLGARRILKEKGQQLWMSWEGRD